MWIFATTMHRGQLLKKKLEEAEINKAAFGRKFGYKSNKSIYLAFENPDLKIDIFIFAIKYYSLDFSKELPNLRKEIIDKMNEEMTGKARMVPMELHVDVMKKYTDQLEANQALLQENLELYRKLKQKKNNNSRVNHDGGRTRRKK